jgi:hypothetical protein
MNTRSSALFALPLLAACLDMDHEVDTIEVSADAAGSPGLVVLVDAGDLSIVGEAGRTTVDATVTVLSSVPSDSNDEEVLRALDLRLEQRESGLLRLVVELPDNYPAYTADVTVLVPEGMDLDVSDGSGDTWIRDVGAVAVVDGSGDLDIDQADGDVVIVDGSGDILLSNVAGDARIEDGSGDMTIKYVDGTVTVTDGSGDVTIRSVGDVVMIEDGSGDVRID